LDLRLLVHRGKSFSDHALDNADLAKKYGDAKQAKAYARMFFASEKDDALWEPQEEFDILGDIDVSSVAGESKKFYENKGLTYSRLVDREVRSETHVFLNPDQQELYLFLHKYSNQNPKVQVISKIFKGER
jgi:hypothetical protein